MEPLDDKNTAQLLQQMRSQTEIKPEQEFGNRIAWRRYLPDSSCSGRSIVSDNSVIGSK